jgi:hypothetical protein
MPRLLGGDEGHVNSGDACNLFSCADGLREARSSSGSDDCGGRTCTDGGIESRSLLESED